MNLVSMKYLKTLTKQDGKTNLWIGDCLMEAWEFSSLLLLMESSVPFSSSPLACPFGRSSPFCCSAHPFWEDAPSPFLSSAAFWRFRAFSVCTLSEMSPSRSGFVGSTFVSKLKKSFQDQDLQTIKGREVRNKTEYVIEEDNSRNARHLKKCFTLSKHKGLQRYQIFILYSPLRLWCFLTSFLGRWRRGSRRRGFIVLRLLLGGLLLGGRVWSAALPSSSGHDFLIYKDVG